MVHGVIFSYILTILTILIIDHQFYNKKTQDKTMRMFFLPALFLLLLYLTAHDTYHQKLENLK